MGFISETVAPTIEPVLRAKTDGIDWSIWVVLSCIAILMLCRNIVPQRFQHILTQLYESGRRDLVRNANTSKEFYGFVVFFVYLATVALSYQYILLVFSDAAQPDFVIFCYTIAILAAIHIMQYLILRLWAFVFNTQAIVKAQTQLHTSSALTFSIAALALCLIAYFSANEIICYISISIWIICFTARMIKTFIEICFSSRLNLFNIFLYLCTLEIAPFAIIATMSVRFVQNGCIC